MGTGDVLIMSIHNNITPLQDDIKRHVHPNAMIMFVPGFGQEIIQEDIIVSETIKEENELVSLDITLTVKNSPGTFTLTLRDPNNKFIIPDDPNYEIPKLREVSNRKIITGTLIGTKGGDHNTIKKGEDRINAPVIEGTTEGENPYLITPPDQVSAPPNSTTYVRKDHKPYRGEFYNWGTYNEWANDYYIVLEDPDTGKRFPTQFIRDHDGSIKERWAFDYFGNIIYVSLTASTFSDTSTEAELIEEIGVSSSISKFYVISEYNSKKPDKKEYITHIFYNSNLVDGKFRDIMEQGGNAGEYKKGRCRISPMDRVIIFMTPRFNTDGSFNESDTAPMIPVFTGVVNTAQQAYSNGEHSITVQGEDITKYMRLSIINVNPALPIGRQVAGQYGDENIHVWQQIFQGLTTPEIIRLLCLGSGSTRKTEALNQKIDGIGFYKLSKKGDLAQDFVYDPINEEWVGQGTSSLKIPRADFRKMLGYLFTDHSVHVYDPYKKGDLSLEGWRPYEISMDSNWSFFQADFKTRREIAYKASEDSFFNFYADRRGHIWFHPYRYDISWILGAENSSVYVMDNESIVSYGFIEDDSELFTEVQITTEPDFGMGDTQRLGFYTGVFRDEGAILKYGQRIFVGVNPIINTKSVNAPGSVSSDIFLSDNREAAANSVKIFAKALLKRLLASKYQGQITLVGRPEIDPGRPIYVPIRNMVYYVETVVHNLAFGSSYTTTLHLSYGRKPWELLPELLTFSDNDEIYLTDAKIFDKKPSVDLEEI